MSLTSWSQIRDYCYGELPKLKSRQDESKGEEPRWVFRGDNPCPKPWHKRNRKEGAGPLKPGNYDLLKEAFKSRLDQAFREFGIKAHEVRHKTEWGLMRTFRRKAHLHTGRRDDDWLERLGLMAHYEAPHRMLDWNYSFFNALYFAVNSRRFERDCIVWALNKRWLRERAERLEEKVIEEMKATLGCQKATRMKKYRDNRSPRLDASIVHYLMLTNRMSCVYPVTPYYQNERLSIQQGTFICPGTTNHTWGENLATVLHEAPDRHALVKIPIYLTTEERKKVLRELHSMNISQATLFPELGGFAQSLRTRLADPETISEEVPPLDSLEI